MLRALSNNVDVLAWEIEKEDGPFYCPVCKGLAFAKKGRIKVHHFAHMPPSTCTYGSGESDEHRHAKKEIYKGLIDNPKVSKLQLERGLGEVRPDISFYLADIPIAIEVQISNLSLDTIDRRTKAYARKGIYLLWTSPIPSGLDYDYSGGCGWIKEEKYSPRIWEKYLHAMYFGKVYYWVGGETLQPVRFDPFQLYVEERTWWEGEGEYAEERNEGGYFRYSKRYKMPVALSEIDITELSPIVRKPWTSKEITIPAARLWCERSEKLFPSKREAVTYS